MPDRAWGRTLRIFPRVVKHVWHSARRRGGGNDPPVVAPSAALVPSPATLGAGHNTFWYRFRPLAVLDSIFYSSNDPVALATTSEVIALSAPASAVVVSPSRIGVGYLHNLDLHLAERPVKVYTFTSSSPTALVDHMTAGNEAAPSITAASNGAAGPRPIGLLPAPPAVASMLLVTSGASPATLGAGRKTFCHRFPRRAVVESIAYFLEDALATREVAALSVPASALVPSPPRIEVARGCMVSLDLKLAERPVKVYTFMSSRWANALVNHATTANKAPPSTTSASSNGAAGPRPIGLLPAPPAAAPSTALVPCTRPSTLPTAWGRKVSWYASRRPASLSKDTVAPSGPTTAATAPSNSTERHAPPMRAGGQPPGWADAVCGIDMAARWPVENLRTALAASHSGQALILTTVTIFAAAAVLAVLLAIAKFVFLDRRFSPGAGGRASHLVRALRGLYRVYWLAVAVAVVATRTLEARALPPEASTARLELAAGGGAAAPAAAAADAGAVAPASDGLEAAAAPATGVKAAEPAMPPADQFQLYARGGNGSTARCCG